MNHYPYYSGSENEEAVTADLTLSVAELANPRGTSLGRAVGLTFRTLGIDAWEKPPHPSDMLVMGSAEKIIDKLPELRKSIGLIARQAADAPPGMAMHPHAVGNAVDAVAQYVIPRAAEQNARFIDMVGQTLLFFGEDCNDDGVLLEYGNRVGWYTQVADDRTKLRSLPNYALRNVTELPIFELEKGRDVSRDTSILRSRARKYLIDGTEAAHKLKKRSRALGGLEERLELDKVALERIKTRYDNQRPGKSFYDMVLPEDLIHQLLDEEVSTIQRERLCEH